MISNKTNTDLNILLKQIGIDELYTDIIDFDFASSIEKRKDTYYEELKRYDNGLLYMNTNDSYKYLRVDLTKTVFQQNTYPHIVDTTIKQLVSPDAIKKQNENQPPVEETVAQLQQNISDLELQKKNLEDSLIQANNTDSTSSKLIQNLLDEIERLHVQIAQLQSQVGIQLTRQTQNQTQQQSGT
jgi:hypothetical protein